MLAFKCVKNKDAFTKQYQKVLKISFKQVVEEFCIFLDASTHLYERVCPSVRPSVRNAFVLNSRKRVISASEIEGMLRGGGRGKEG